MSLLPWRTALSQLAAGDALRPIVLHRRPRRRHPTTFTLVHACIPAGTLTMSWHLVINTLPMRCFCCQGCRGDRGHRKDAHAGAPHNMCIGHESTADHSPKSARPAAQALPAAHGSPVKLYVMERTMFQMKEIPATQSTCGERGGQTTRAVISGKVEQRILSRHKGQKGRAKSKSKSKSKDPNPRILIQERSNGCFQPSGSQRGAPMLHGRTAREWFLSCPARRGYL